MNLQELTVEQASHDLNNKKYSAVELAESVFSRIDTVDKKVEAFILVTKKQALASARKYDEGKAPDTMIAGVPGSLKDLFNWKGTVTTASSNIIKNYVSPYNATVTQRLIDAGAVIAGKTNMDAFAHGSSTETSDFFTTKNPWNLGYLPGGSSGGSAAAVISGMGLYSIGTETAGSIRHPSSWCGLTGLKPTYGRVSRYGVIAMGSSLDSPGPICKSVVDCAILLEVLAGNDPKDATTSPSKPGSYYKDMNSDVKGLKIGLPRRYFDEEQIEGDVIKKVREALVVLEKRGAQIVDIELMDPKYAIAVYTFVCRSEVSSNLARFDGIRYGHVSEKHVESIDELISNNRGSGFGQEAKRRIMTGTYALSSGYYDAYYKKAQQVRNLIKKDMEAAFKKVDVIIGPTTPSTALKVGATEGNPLFGEISDVLVEAGTMSGCPGLTLPVGFDKKDLPVGMNVVAPQFDEQLLINIGSAFQEETDWHKKYPNL